MGTERSELNRQILEQATRLKESAALLEETRQLHAAAAKEIEVLQGEKAEAVAKIAALEEKVAHAMLSIEEVEHESPPVPHPNPSLRLAGGRRRADPLQGPALVPHPRPPVLLCLLGQELSEFRGAVFCLQYSPNGAYLATGDGNREVRTPMHPCSHASLYPTTTRHLPIVQFAFDRSGCTTAPRIMNACGRICSSTALV